MRQAHTARSAPGERDQRGTSETSGASYRTSEISAGRAETSAERDQWREPPDERDQRGRAETSRRSETSGASCRTSQEPAVWRDCADRSESVIWGGARGTSARGESQASGDARYKRREGVRGRPKAAGRLAQKLPSPALKEAERSGSYNLGDLNTLTGGTVRSGTVQGQQREEQRTPCPVNLRGPERTRSGEARRVRDTDQGQESVLRRD